MSLHIFEQHQIDCSFYRTGQMIITVTAGVGVFEVDYRPETSQNRTNYSESSDSSNNQTRQEFLSGSAGTGRSIKSNKVPYL